MVISGHMPTPCSLFGPKLHNRNHAIVYGDICVSPQYVVCTYIIKHLGSAYTNYLCIAASEIFFAKFIFKFFSFFVSCKHGNILK